MTTASPASFGEVNGHLVGIAMKELVRRAIEAIRVERFAFDVQAKRSYGGDLNDLVTSADRKAQEIYLRSLRECFPTFGIVAEEDALAVACTHTGADYYFTVDPLDGTKAFARRQSSGVGTMLALVLDGEVIAAYVGDVMTQEIFGGRPGSTSIHRISEYGKAQPLEADPARPLAEQHVLLRNLPEFYPAVVRGLVSGDRPLFRGADVTGGSIGLSLARLWKGEVGAAAILPSHDTPWDLAPVLGICDRLGFVFLRVGGDVLEEYRPTVPKQPRPRDFAQLVVHRSRVAELANWLGPGKTRFNVP
jgi:fructose-1,6-bisphosphatase/inositol monophosphatase family enzyme